MKLIRYPTNMPSQGSPCPYGPELQVYWDQRYQLFSRFDHARVDRTGLYTMVPERHALDMAERASGETTLDLCSGIGSMSIAFARAGQRVTAVELDPGRVDMARHNARLYWVEDRIDFLQADVTAIDSPVPGGADTLFLDPPWGAGPGDYMQRPVVYLTDLRLAGLDPRDLVGRFECREVMMRLPQNFDIGVTRNLEAEKIAYVTGDGYLHWYYIRAPREQFLGLADRSPAGLTLNEARAGFRAHYVPM